MDTLPSVDLQPSNQPWTGSLPAEESRVDFWGLVARRKWLILLGLVTGLGLSYLYFAQATEWFQSSAKIRIRPKNQAQVAFVNNDNLIPGSETFLKRHDKDITSERIVRRCFEESAELSKMGIFDGLAEEERLRKVLRNLEVRPDKEDGEVFDLNFKATNSTEAKTMLNSILTTYAKDLEQQFSSESDRVVTTFKGFKTWLSEYIVARQKTRDEIYELAKKNSVSDVIVGSNNLSLHNVKVGELNTQLEQTEMKRAELQAEISWIYQRLNDQKPSDSSNAAAVNEIVSPDLAVDSIVFAAPDAAIQDQTSADENPTQSSENSTNQTAQSAPAGDGVTPGVPELLKGENSEIVVKNEYGADATPPSVPDTAASPSSISMDLPKTGNVQGLEGANIGKDGIARLDPVPGMIKEIFEKLRTKSEGATHVIMALALIRRIDRPIELNKGALQPSSNMDIDKNRYVLDWKQKIEMLMSDRESKIQELGAKHPEIQNIDRNIQRMSNMLATLEKNDQPILNSDGPKPYSDEQFLAAYVSNLALSYSSLVSQMPGLKQELAYHLGRAEMLNVMARKLKDAEEEVTMYQEFLKETQKTLAQINPRYIDDRFVDNEKEGFNIVSLDSPSSGNRIWPDLPLVLGLGGLVGSLFGLCLGYFVDMADKTFHNPEEIMRQLSMPLIGHIPVIQQSKRHVIENSYIDPSICTYHRPKSQASEAFRAIRTALFFSTKGKTNSVIQVTSPTPGDGKSTIAANIAVSIAQSGKRVLLLDADMRRPTVHHSFGIKTKEGFPQVLNGEKTWRNAVYECKEIPGLSILPCGDKPPNPAELISTPRVGELIEEMKNHYDFIIIDTPPVLAVTDPCPVAARVDGVILSIRIKKNVKISSDRAAEILHSVGANLIGVVVNGVGNQSGYGSQYSYGAYRAGYQYNGYGYGYGYSYGYGKQAEDEKPGRPAPIRNLQAPQSNDVEVS